MSERIALYFVPESATTLWQAGSAWLGRDAETGAALTQPDLPGIAAVTADPARYGFHATLKPPFRLAAGATRADAIAATEALAASFAPFALPPLMVRALGAFVALCEAAPCPQAQALADAALTWLDPLRAPTEAAEILRRRQHTLSRAEAANLERWGYPYAFDTWRFHMSLTGRLPAADRARWEAAAHEWLAPALREPARVESLGLFCEAEPGAPFRLIRRVGLGG